MTVRRAAEIPREDVRPRRGRRRGRLRQHLDAAMFARVLAAGPSHPTPIFQYTPMTSNDTSAEQIRQTKELLKNVGKDDLAERFDAELSDRADAAQQVVEMKTLAENAEAAGLDDDPAVQALRDRADALQADLGLGPEPHHPSKLAEEYGLREDIVAEFSEDHRQELHGHLQAVDEIEDSTRTMSTAGQAELQRRRDRMADLIDREDVMPSKLVADDANGQQAELSAALAGGDPDDVDDSGSPRVQAARLRDRKADLEERIDDAERALLEMTLQQRLDRVEDDLADIKED